MKTHNQTHFYKYVTATTAKIILETLKVRCSSPLTFNDPFDSQVPITIGPASPEEQIINLLEYLKNDDNKQIILNHFAKHGMQNINSLIQSYNHRIYNINREDRVFCVSEKKDNILMWSHYADNHTGAVIKFKCVPEIDSGLCGAKKVKYSVNMPKLSILDFVIDNYVKANHIQELIVNEILLTKSIDWQYEQEWRVILFPRDDKSNLPDKEQYDDIGIFEQELDSIYLGCKMKLEDRESIIDVVKNNRPNMKVFQTTTDNNEFRLNFNEVILSDILK